MSARTISRRELLEAGGATLGASALMYAGLSCAPTRMPESPDTEAPGKTTDGGEQQMGAIVAVVVYESLWGSTARVARAIAEGIGAGARALSTAEATAEAIAGAGLIVAGAPVHAMGLPTDRTREQARTGNMGPGGAPPDLSHPSMRAWLEALPRGHGRAAAFETHVDAWYGRGAAPKIAAALERAGYQPLAEPRGFSVGGSRLWPSTDGTLCEGEVERARQWGAELARAMA